MTKVERSMLEDKGIAELRQIAKSLDIKVSGLRKSEVIDRIMGLAGADNGEASAPARRDNGSQSSEKDASVKTQAPPKEETQEPLGNGAPHPEAVVREQAPPVDSFVAPERLDEGPGTGVSDHRPADRDTRTRPRERIEPREGRGRRRRRGRSRGESQFAREAPYEETEVEDDTGAEVRTGILDLLPEGYGFLRTTGYLPGEKDVYVSASQVRRFQLRRGDEITGSVRQPRDSEKYPALLKIHSINGLEPEQARGRVRFGDLTPLYPEERLVLEQKDNPRLITPRIIDLVAPIGKGQRGMIVSPPKAGKTTIMKDIAKSILKNNPEIHLIVLLVDERPEEVTDMQRSVDGEIIYSTFDRPSEDHIQVTELTLERAKRLVELGRDVVILLDGITRLSRAYNLATPASGRILSGGVDSTALYPPKRFFGAARNIEQGGSLTILATALVETGSRMDEVIFEEFKGTGNWELRLDRRLSERRIFPAIDIQASGTRKEELLLRPDELQLVWRLRRVLHALTDGGALELLVDKMKQTPSNAEFLREIAKAPVKGE